MIQVICPHIVQMDKMEPKPELENELRERAQDKQNPDGPREENAPSALVPYDPVKLRRDQARVDKGFWPKARRLAQRLPFMEDLLAAYFCATDPNSPLHVRAVLMGALAYFVIPLDLLPDFIAFLGYSDDATVLYGAIRTVADNITPVHRTKARETLARSADDGDNQES